MGKILKKITALFMTGFMIFTMTACSEQSSIIRYDISQGADSLDPQFCTGETEQIILYNTFEGLVRQKPSGEIVPCAAKSYKISENGLKYTFVLKDNMNWDDESTDKKKGYRPPTPVTADDFVFAFQRIFNQISPSPYAQKFMAIGNASKILSGEMLTSSLKVSAQGEQIVEFILDYADPMFLENLAHSSALPCSQKLFDEANGKYGSSVATTPANGPFRMIVWDNESKIYMQKNQFYYDAVNVKTPGVYLMMNRDKQTDIQAEKNERPPTRFELVMDGKSDSCQADYAQARKAKKAGFNYVEVDGTVWALVFNQNTPSFANEKVRQGFVRAIDRTPIEHFFKENNQNNLTVTDRLVPPAITMFTKPYTSISSLTSINNSSPESAKQIYKEGMAELGADTLRRIQLLVPSESNIPDMCSLLQQTWQKNLSVFVNIEEIPKEDLATRLKLGDYNMALVPIKSSTNSPGDSLGKFASSSLENISGNKNPLFDEALAKAAVSYDEASILESYITAEKILVDSAAAMPLMVETNYFIIGKNVSGIEFYPYGNQVYFKNASAMR